MAESSWPSPANGRVVDDVQYEKLGLGLGPVAGVVGAFTSPQLVYGDSSGMQIKVAADRYAHVSGHAWWSGSSIFTKAIGSNASGSTRTDLVVARLSRTTWDVTTVVIPGTPGAGAPAPTQNTGTTGSYDLPLATVTVASGAATISAGNVTYVASHLMSDGSGLAVPSTAALTHVPAKFTGMRVYDAGTRQLVMYDGSAWQSTGVADRGYYPSQQWNDSTTIAPISSTTYIPGSPVVGGTFVAPPSGAVWATIGGLIRQGNNGQDIRLAYEIRAGAVLGSGTVLWAASVGRSIQCGQAVNTSAPAVLSASHRQLVGSMTPGATYNIRTMYAVSGGSGTVEYRVLSVEPQIG